MSASHAARELAKYGRYGDTHLLHVNEAELAGLASLAPGGRLPVNPVTGLPEAFFFLPFLSALFGAAAPAAAGAAAAIPATMAAAAPAALTGLAAPTIASLGSGALTAGLQAGATAASALPAAATAAQTAAQTLTPALTAASEIPQAATGLQAAGQGIASLPEAASHTMTFTSPSMTYGAPELTGMGAKLPMTGLDEALAGSGDMLGGFAELPANPTINGAAVHPMSAPKTPLAGTTNTPSAFQQAMGAGADTSYFPPPPSAGGGGGLGSLLGGMDMNQMLLPAMLLSQMGGGGGGDSEEGGGDVPEGWNGEDPVFPGDDYEPGIDPEWKYFNHGGLVKGYAAGGPVQATIIPQDPMGGGLQSLTAPPMMQPENMPKAQLDSPYSGEETMPGENDEELIAATVEAILGRSPNADQIIMEFIKVFGEQALQDLVSRIKGSGDGMSDSIPATVNGQQPAALSDGEYVVPADVVSGLGNGSTGAGAERLNEMAGRVRTMRGGGPVQPPAIDPSRAMPA